MGAFGIVKSDVQVTLEELKQKFPAKKHTINQETVDFLNEALSNKDFDSAQFMNNLVDYQSCMLEASASMQEYVNAIRFCAYLETCPSAVEAYKKARAKDKFVQDRWNSPSDSKEYTDLVSAASRYRKSKLVRQILTQSDMPLYLMFQAERYKAVTVLAREMQTAALSKDRIAAAKELLAAVKPPENVQIELGIGPNREARDLQLELNAQLAKLAANQKALLEAGVDLRDVQRTGIRLNDVQDAEIE